jgi:hypothetical protein
VDLGIKLLASAKVRDKFCACIECFLYTDVNFLVQCSWIVEFPLKNLPLMRRPFKVEFTKVFCVETLRKNQPCSVKNEKSKFLYLCQESRISFDTIPLKVRCHEMENMFLSTSVPKKFSGKTVS